MSTGLQAPRSPAVANFAFMAGGRSLNDGTAFCSVRNAPQAPAAAAWAHASASSPKLLGRSSSDLKDSLQLWWKARLCSASLAALMPMALPISDAAVPVRSPTLVAAVVVALPI